MIFPTNKVETISNKTLILWTDVPLNNQLDNWKVFLDDIPHVPIRTKIFQRNPQLCLQVFPSEEETQVARILGLKGVGQVIICVQQNASKKHQGTETKNTNTNTKTKTEYTQSEGSWSGNDLSATLILA